VLLVVDVLFDEPSVKAFPPLPARGGVNPPTPATLGGGVNVVDGTAAPLPALLLPPLEEPKSNCDENLNVCAKPNDSFDIDRVDNDDTEASGEGCSAAMLDRCVYGVGPDFFLFFST
jgi:hypothetical protein